MNQLTKKNKILLISTSVSLILILTVTMLTLYFTTGHNFNKYYQPRVDYSLFNKETFLTETQIQEDKRELINRVENTHPYFAIKDVMGYEAAKQKFINSNIKTAGDLYFEAAEYLAVFNDLHTTAIAIFYEYLDLGLSRYVDNNRLMVYPYGEENAAYELFAINNVELKQIFSKYTPSENDNSAFLGFPRIFINDFLIKAGIKWQDSLTFTYKKTDGTFFNVNHNIIKDGNDNFDGSIQTPKNFEAKITDDSILYIYARAMSDDGSYKDCVNFIKNAVQSGIKKAVIDVTGNGGGSDSFGLGILDALGFEYSKMGFTIKYSEVTSKYRGTWRKSGYKNKRQFNYQSKNNNNIELKVFCDEYTASAAMAVVNQCRYSDLGEIIGRMPGQNTNFCGNGIVFQLTHSKVCYMLPLSYSYFERNGQKAPDLLIPDIEVSALVNYMDYAVWNK